MSHESLDFTALFAASGWSQREAADKLFTTPATVSRYLGGQIPVPRSVTEMLRLVLAAERPPGPAPAGPRAEFARLCAQLGEIEDADAAAYATVKLMIESVHGRAVAQRGEAGPPLRRVSRDELPRALAQAHPLRSEVSERKPKAASTSGSKPAPRPRVSRRPSSPRPAPAPVPAGRES